MPDVVSRREGHSAENLVAELVARGQTVAFCESLTAGLACARVADVPGASRVLRGGLVTYATDLKHSLAGVPAELLEREGPVSPETAQAMARGTRTVCGATWGISLTGVAGPDSQDGHPVGEVFIGIAGPEGEQAWPAAEWAEVKVTRLAEVEQEAESVRVLAGDRATIRRNSADAAISAMVSVLREQIRTKDRWSN